MSSILLFAHHSILSQAHPPANSVLDEEAAEQDSTVSTSSGVETSDLKTLDF
jgi:hypothetical protein